MTARPSAAQVRDAARLYAAVASTARWMRRHPVAPLSSGAMSALATVNDAGPIRIGDLAVREGVQPATLSRIVGLLEEEGYVSRDLDQEDRRSAFLTATRAGRTVVDAVRRERGQALLERLNGLTPTDRTALLAALPALEALAEAGPEA